MNPSARQIPRRIVYPLRGIALSIGAALGFLLVRLVSGHVGLAPAAILADLRVEAVVYGYVAASTMLMTLIFGAVLGSKEDRLEATSVTDSLTGLFNRRSFHDRFAEELDRAMRYGSPLALLVVDLDWLKRINDGGGHIAGDAALRSLADCLRRCCRAADLPARWGGDEFAIVAPNTTATEALALAARIREALRETSARAGSKAARVTVSIGITDAERSGSFRPDALYSAADRALYSAKQNGRDGAVIAPRSALRDAPRDSSPIHTDR